MIPGSSPEAPASEVCVNHSKAPTVVHCSKCGRPICTRCMVSTPVGMRCRECARLKKLPQFDVGPLLLARAALAGLGASLLTWLLATGIPYLLFFTSIFVGVAVSSVMAPLAKRRTSRWLEAAAVLDLALGLLAASAIRSLLHGGASVLDYSVQALIVPLLIASVIAVVRLR